MEDWQIALLVIVVPVAIVLFLFGLMKLRSRMERGVEVIAGRVPDFAEDNPDEFSEIVTQLRAQFSSPESIQRYTSNLEQLRKTQASAPKTPSLDQKNRQLQRLNEDYQRASQGILDGNFSTQKRRELRQLIDDLYEREKKKILDE
jgi:hypothetical protein